MKSRMMTAMGRTPPNVILQVKFVVLCLPLKIWLTSFQIIFNFRESAVKISMIFTALGYTISFHLFIYLVTFGTVQHNYVISLTTEQNAENILQKNR